MSGVKFSHMLLDIKNATNMTDAAFDSILAFITTHLLPFTHTYPGTWHTINKLIGPKDSKTMERWMCPCQQHSWGQLPEHLKAEVVDTPPPHTQEEYDNLTLAQ